MRGDRDEVIVESRLTEPKILMCHVYEAKGTKFSSVDRMTDEYRDSDEMAKGSDPPILSTVHFDVLHDRMLNILSEYVLYGTRTNDKPRRSRHTPSLAF